MFPHLENLWFILCLIHYFVHSLPNSLFIQISGQSLTSWKGNLPTALTQAGKSAYYIFSYDQVPPLHCTSHRCKSIELCEFLKLVCSPNDLNFP